MSIELVMPSNHLILFHPLLLSSIFPSIRVFSNDSVLHIRWTKYWSFSFSISPSNEYSGLISFRMYWLDLLAVQGTLKSLLQHHSSKASITNSSNFSWGFSTEGLFCLIVSYYYCFVHINTAFASEDRLCVESSLPTLRSDILWLVAVKIMISSPNTELSLWIPTVAKYMSGTNVGGIERHLRGIFFFFNLMTTMDCNSSCFPLCSGCQGTQTQICVTSLTSVQDFPSFIFTLYVFLFISSAAPLSFLEPWGADFLSEQLTPAFPPGRRLALSSPFNLISDSIKACRSAFSHQNQCHT